MSDISIFKTAIVLFSFNRPLEVQAVFEKIALLKPAKLFLVADGPRLGHSSDEVMCKKVRAIISNVKWKCQLFKLFFDTNQGCYQAFLQGMNWVFQNETRAIILEDDCLPDSSFFPFCQELLDYYQDNDRIMSIGGYRYLPDEIENTESYCFSKYTQSWGWATWKRAWDLMDSELVTWENISQSTWLESYLTNLKYSVYWKYIFNKMRRGMNTWDYAWVYSCWRNNGLTVHPKVNLITPIGFGNNATHTKDKSHPASFRKGITMPFPLVHPKEICTNNAVEDWIEKHYFSAMNERRLKIGISRILATRKINPD
jgi:hypothetical protein